MLLYPKCLELTPPGKLNKSLTWNNMASIYYMRKNFEKAAELWETASKIHPEVEFLQYRLALALTKSRKFEEALTNLDELISKRPEYTDYILLKGSALLEQHRLEESLAYFRKALRQKPYSPEVVKSIGTVFHLMHDFRKAELYFKNANSLNPEDPVTLLWLAATNLKLEDTADAEHYLDKLFAVISVSKLQLLLETISNPENMISSQRELFILFPLISAKLSERIYIDAPQEGHSVNKPG
jgi:tetratricopeptide (TPR) repeat protein